MIPKIIHYYCSNTYRIGPLAEKCWASWKRVLPDYQFILHGESEIPDTPWVRECRKNGNPANTSFPLTCKLLLDGGIILNNDIEMLKPFDLNHPAFVGFQRDDTWDGAVNVAVIACEPGHRLGRDMLIRGEAKHPSSHPIEFGPRLITEQLIGYGLYGLNFEQTLGDIKVYSKEKFYPWRWDETPDMNRVTPDTFCIHWWEGSWAKP